MCTPSRSAALACGQAAKTPWALCEKAPLEAHPGLARQGELDTRGLSDDVVAPTALGSYHTHPSVVLSPLETPARHQRYIFIIGFISLSIEGGISQLRVPWLGPPPVSGCSKLTYHARNVRITE